MKGLEGFWKCSGCFLRDPALVGYIYMVHELSIWSIPWLVIHYPSGKSGGWTWNLGAGTEVAEDTSECALIQWKSQYALGTFVVLVS